MVSLAMSSNYENLGTRNIECCYNDLIGFFYIFLNNIYSTPIVKLGCGAEFSMILDCNGALHSFGLPEYGQLGKIAPLFFFSGRPKKKGLFFFI